MYPIYTHIVYRKLRPVAKFIVPDWEEKVDSGIGLSYRPAARLLGWPAGVNYNQPPFRDYEFGCSTIVPFGVSLFFEVKTFKTAR
jgi:hypothetical protein